MTSTPSSNRGSHIFCTIKIDCLLVLSRGPDGGVPAPAADCGKDEWLASSDTIQCFHELNYVICRRLYPGDVAPLREELVADAVELYAAFGSFDPKIEQIFLGIRDGRYTGGQPGQAGSAGR